MPKIYIEVPIAERMPVIGERPHRLDKIVLIDNCGVKHLRPYSETVLVKQESMLQLGYVSWLEELEVSEDVLELVKGGSKCN
ncbi:MULTISPECIES: hypothetical protein [Sphingobacterium]|uniref:Uncharacterized protein n=1 Tax=Sphingobacterium populi TaxID=1812824 RepID=A0ABW5U7X8_9SPHI|nr:hypothetical protein [Sphingobacterium sp. CFCC 11742]